MPEVEAHCYCTAFTATLVINPCENPGNALAVFVSRPSEVDRRYSSNFVALVVSAQTTGTEE